MSGRYKSSSQLIWHLLIILWIRQKCLIDEQIK